MKFESMFPDAVSGATEFFEQSEIAKQKTLAECRSCGSMTRWSANINQQVRVCSGKCLGNLKDAIEKAKAEMQKLESDPDVQRELEWAKSCKDDWKDIIIVVRDQYDYIKQCIESIQKNTKKYRLFVWDNGSGSVTQTYLEDVFRNCLDDNVHMQLVRNPTNIGFIEPNNRLVDMGKSPYVILLNSDCLVFAGWTDVLLGGLQQNPQMAEIGYLGGCLDEDAKGNGKGVYGYDIDFVCGFCACLKRETINEHGLFNKQLQFAYCEDSDLSLRLKESGHTVYAAKVPLVHHFGNKTVKQVAAEKQIDIRSTFEKNHEYMKVRWKDYLSNNRVALRSEGPRDG